MTSSPLTTTPWSAVFCVQPTPGAVVGAPGPDVVQDHVVAVHHQAGGRLAGVRPADAEEHVLQRRRVGGARRRAGRPCGALLPTCTQRRAVPGAGVEGDSGDVDAGHVGDRQRRRRPGGRSGWRARGPRTTVSARVTAMRAVDVVDARGEQQVLALRQRAVDALHRVAGLARRRIAQRQRAARRRPVGPAGARGVASAPTGTKTLPARRGRRRRGRASRGETGVVASVVYGLPRSTGKRLRRARPATPEKTWFHTPLVQPPIAAVAGVELLLAAVDDGAVDRGVGDEAAAGVLRPGGAVVHERQVAPVTCTRRIGAACETAQNSVAVRQPSPPGGLMVRLRQRAPEVVQRDAVAPALALVVDVDGAVDDHVARVLARARRPRCSSRPGSAAGSRRVPYVPGLNSSA